MAEIPEWTAALLKGDFEPMRALVRELAESDPTVVVSEMGDRECAHCHARGRYKGVTHADTCLWLRARKMAGM